MTPDTREVVAQLWPDSPTLARIDAQSQPADGIDQAVPGADDLEDLA